MLSKMMKKQKRNQKGKTKRKKNAFEWMQT